MKGFRMEPFFVILRCEKIPGSLSALFPVVLHSERSGYHPFLFYSPTGDGDRHQILQLPGDFIHQSAIY